MIFPSCSFILSWFPLSLLHTSSCSSPHSFPCIQSLLFFDSLCSLFRVVHVRAHIQNITSYIVCTTRSSPSPSCRSHST
ncbi:hypothetical protein B0H14DRAFT_2965360 [Mycena olivaceomarginata]|nr:hypothetical protein B0H14DRAFT_2965360 [Mycena olivaceomarginata]